MTPDLQALKAAYFYLLGRVYAIRQERTDVAQTPYNVIKYNPLGLESADFVNPNLDVAYLEAWIAVDDDRAVLLHVPPIRGRYYTVQVLDGWGEVIANVNPRNDPAHPCGPVAFVKAGTNPQVPPGALIVPLPAAKAKVLARVELSHTPREAVALQRAFALQVPPGIAAQPAPHIPAFDNPQLPGAWVFDRAEAILASYPDAMPGAHLYAHWAREAAAFAATGGARQLLQRLIDQQFSPYFFREVIGGRSTQNGWSLTDAGGRFGADYMARTLVNYAGIWANVPEEVIYYSSRKDGEGRPLAGSATYALRFAPDALPHMACTAFWSLTMLRLPDYRVAPNPINRFSINNASGAKKDADGALTLYLAPEPPPNIPQENWLPSPKDTEITLTFRLYVPTERALNKQWYVPPLRRM